MILDTPAVPRASAVRSRPGPIHRHRASRTHSQTGRRRLAVGDRRPAASCTTTSRVLARLRAWRSSQERRLNRDDCSVTAQPRRRRSSRRLVSDQPTAREGTSRCSPMDCTRRHIVRARGASLATGTRNERASAVEQRGRRGCRPSAASLPLAVRWLSAGQGCRPHNAPSSSTGRLPSRSHRLLSVFAHRVVAHRGRRGALATRTPDSALHPGTCLEADWINRCAIGHVAKERSTRGAGLGRSEEGSTSAGWM